MSVTAFPLSWPPQFPRAKSREKGTFKTTLAGALTNVETSLQRFANDSGISLKNLVISSNVTLGVNRPADPGVAIWFAWGDMQVCIPVDRYQTVEANLQAIHHIIEARRVELRHGTLALVRATFQGFLSLPAPTTRQWWEMLEIDRNATLEEARKAYQKLASVHHPDKGGNHLKMAGINWAWEQAQKAAS